jgi:hypothetical protein
VISDEFMESNKKDNPEWQQLNLFDWHDSQHKYSETPDRRAHPFAPYVDEEAAARVSAAIEQYKDHALAEHCRRHGIELSDDR